MLRNIFFFILFASSVLAQKMQLQNVDTKTDASFRGLSVINDSIAWVSGSKGWIGTTENGGRGWSFRRVKGFEQCDFRSLYAFNLKEAVIVNAGSPAYILRTSDGGSTWRKVYENDDIAAFIDGIDFWDHKNGVVYGDPIKGHILLLGTDDGGETWTSHPPAECPVMSPGEASFAASGTCIKCVARRKIIIATGGKVSRLLVSENRGKSWVAITTPILQERESTGIFSFLPIDNNRWLIAGGDYKNDSLRAANLFITSDGGKTWYPPAITTRGYRECLEMIGGTLLAVGPGGIDVSYDNGNNWTALSDEKQFHVVKKSRSGNLIIIAGGQGKVSVMKLSK